MQIFINRNNQKHGPYSLHDVQAYLASGQLNGADLAWYEGAPGWIPLSQVPGVQMPAGRVPPPPPVQAVPPSVPVTKAKSKAPLIGCGCLAAFFIVVFAPVCNRMIVNSERAKQRSVEVGKQLDAGDERMRQRFDNIEKIARNHPELRQRIRDLRIEWEEGKRDPQKLELVQRKMDLLQKDIQEGRY